MRFYHATQSISWEVIHFLETAPGHGRVKFPNVWERHGSEIEPELHTRISFAAFLADELRELGAFSPPLAPLAEHLLGLFVLFPR